MKQVNLYEAKTSLSSLVDAASKGEEIIIAKNGKALARLMPLAEDRRKREIVWGRYDHLGWKLPDDFDDPDPGTEALWYGDGKPDGEI